MEFIKEYRDLVEFIYFISGPLMLVGIIVAIIQLKQFKKEVNARVSRESINSSLLIMEKKFGDFEAIYDKTFELNGAFKFPEFEGVVNGFSRSSIECTNDWLEFFDKIDSTEPADIKNDFEEHDEILEFLCGVEDALNKLETISQYLLSGVADEMYCYNLESESFLEYVKELKPFIAVYREGENHRTYENVIKVYQLWQSRYDHEITLHKKYQLEEKLQSMPAQKKVAIIGK